MNLLHQNLPLVTAVIPTRNRPQLVARAVRSALAQTYAAVNVVVVIDGEDDATQLVLDAIVEPRLRVVALRESAGAAEARNIGVREAAGEWIAFLDDDDEWLPEKLEKQMRVALSSESAFPIISCRLIARTPLREYIWPRRIPSAREPVSEYILARRGLFQGEGLVTTSTILTRRELILRVPFRRGQQRHQDWDWLFRATNIAGAELLFADEPLSVWYVEEGRESLSGANNWRYSYEWIERVRPTITPRAYSAFLLTAVAAIAARSGERRRCLAILADAIRKGKPAAIDLLLFCGMVVIPQDFRRRLRALFSQ